MTDARTDVRTRLREAGEESAGRIEAFFLDALDASKEVWSTCGKCSRRTAVVVPDWSARLKAVEALLDQGYGRVRQEDSEDAGLTLIVERKTPSLREQLKPTTGEP